MVFAASVSADCESFSLLCTVHDVRLVYLNSLLSYHALVCQICVWCHFSTLYYVEYNYSRPSLIQTSSMRPLTLSDLGVTVQLEYFLKSVCFISVFKWSSVYKCMGFN